MSIETTISANAQQLTIFVDKTFDFSQVQNFRLAFSQAPDTVSTVVINLQKTDYMDSSALGMLLNMHKTLSAHVKEFKIEHCRPAILKILQIAHFDKKFQIC